MMGKQIIGCSNNPVVVNAVSHALDHHGHRLTVCQRGLEVLGAVGVIASDLVILDLETPGLSVPLLISAINELAPEVPVVAISTRPGVDVRALSQKGVACATLPSDRGDAAHPFLTELGLIAGSRRGCSAGQP